jgi:hypothetical protein
MYKYKNKMSFTFITALFDISREKHDGRSYSEYQEWFKKTLQIPAPMVIYTELKNENIINNFRRTDYPTKVIYSTLEEIPFYYTKPNVEHIIKNTKFKYRIQHPNGLENICFDYIPIVNSKFKWVSESIKNNYFNTEMFFWIDAGLSRFLKFDLSQDTFDRTLLKYINENNKIYMQIGKKEEFEKLLKNEISFENAVGKNINFMMAGFWGGNKDLILDICTKCAEMYIKEFIEKEQVDNEQVIFGFIIKQYLSNVCLIPNIMGKEYFNYYVFCGKS